MQIGEKYGYLEVVELGREKRSTCKSKKFVCCVQVAQGRVGAAKTDIRK